MVSECSLELLRAIWALRQGLWEERVGGHGQARPEPGVQPCFSARSSVSTIRNQRYHIHANLSFAVLVAQALLLISFHCRPGTVSVPSAHRPTTPGRHPLLPLEPPGRPGEPGRGSSRDTDGTRVSFLCSIPRQLTNTAKWADWEFQNPGVPAASQGYFPHLATPSLQAARPKLQARSRCLQGGGAPCSLGAPPTPAPTPWTSRVLRPPLLKRMRRLVLIGRPQPTPSRTSPCAWEGAWAVTGHS